MNELPIVKYEGILWFFDERLNELRSIKNPGEINRLDSSGFEAKYFKDKIANTKPVMVYDCEENDIDETL